MLRAIDMGTKRMRTYFDSSLFSAGRYDPVRQGNRGPRESRFDSRYLHDRSTWRCCDEGLFDGFADAGLGGL